MSGDLSISRDDLLAAAMIYGGFQKTFTANDFTDFLKSQDPNAEEEDVDEVLQSLAEAGELRRVGPGVYARPLQQ